MVVASSTVYTDGDETYDDLLLPLIKDALSSGELNGVHPAIMNATYVERMEDAAPESEGIGKTGLIIACAGVAAFALVALVIVAVAWRKKKFRSVTAEADAAPSPPLPHFIVTPIQKTARLPTDASVGRMSIDVERRAPSPPVSHFSVTPIQKTKRSPTGDASAGMDSKVDDVERPAFTLDMKDEDKSPTDFTESKTDNIEDDTEGSTGGSTNELNSRTNENVKKVSWEDLL